LNRDLANSDPALFLQRFPPPVLIDEIQYAPELFPVIKTRVDQEKKNGQFWQTGSQPFHFMRGVSESLAERVGILTLQGFFNREQTGNPKAPPFLPNTDRGLFYNSYVQTYIPRDVRDLIQVGDELSFLRFLRAAAARTGQLLNLAEMAQDSGIAPNTAKKWLSILKTSGLIHLLEPYPGNVTKRLIKSPKLYFLDTGLVAFLTEWSSPETLEAGALSSAVLETWVISEILKFIPIGTRIRRNSIS
jgi:predicted AAA+ superfamily ATPase